MTPFVLAHFSDPHLSPPGGSGGVELKSRLAQAAWRRKGHVHRPDVLAALVADIQALAPDHIALTGDLINFGAADEMEAARAWLEGLGDPRDVTVSPGNHDLLVPASLPALEAWRPWLGDEPGEFPRLRVRGGVALINLCSGLPTPIFSARGALGAAQGARLEAMLRETRSQGLHRVVLVHHPAVPGAAPWRKALTDLTRFAEIVRSAGAELVLHGHLHRPLLGHLAGPDGPIPVIGAPSASSGGEGRRAARWHVLAFTPTADGVETQVTARGLRPDGTMGELGGYRLAARTATLIVPASS